MTSVALEYRQSLVQRPPAPHSGLDRAGEGKTLTASLAAVLAGWTRRPCHIVTVNDYLAQRDAAWLRPLYEFCGVSVGCVTGIMNAVDRAHGYACDVTYTTSKEVTADF